MEWVAEIFECRPHAAAVRSDKTGSRVHAGPSELRHFPTLDGCPSADVDKGRHGDRPAPRSRNLDAPWQTASCEPVRFVAVWAVDEAMRRSPRIAQATFKFIYLNRSLAAFIAFWLCFASIVLSGVR